MTRNERSPDQNGGSGQWLKSNLSALGSATVFAVYAAGFVRTRDAAASLQDLPVRRVHTATLAAPTSSGAGSVAPTPTPETTEARSSVSPGSPPNIVSAPAPSASPAPVVGETPEVQTPASKVPSAAKPLAQSPSTEHVASAPTAAPAATAKPSTSAPATVVASAPVSAAPATVAPPTPAPAKSVPVTPVPTPTPTAPATTSTPAAATSAPAAPAAAQRVGFKDGTFVGYGRSRHGDIELTIDILNGQIIDATITQCLTEYSCSWIVALPPQIVARQSAEVDIVSGATASSDAFYAAALQALSKAK